MNSIESVATTEIAPKKVLGIIPARGGSKGLPRKNVLVAGKKPLIAWTIEAARKSSVIDRLIISSDDEEIIKVAEEYKCEVPFRRPSSIASDEATTIDVVLHALDIFPDFEYVVLLQPTSPLRTSEDIDAAFRLLQIHNAQSCVSVSRVELSPYWMYSVDEKNKLKPIIPNTSFIPRRQNLPNAYFLNGAIYIAETSWLRSKRCFLDEETLAYLMPKTRSLDIDDMDDFLKFKARVE